MSDLKLHISLFYRTSPTPSTQRLIYTGRLLCDEEILKQVMKENEDTVHLAIRGQICSPATTPSHISPVCPSPPISTVTASTAASSPSPVNQSLGEQKEDNGKKERVANITPVTPFTPLPSTASAAPFHSPIFMQTAPFFATPAPHGYLP